MRQQISVVIITYNEEKNIGRCLDSVRPVADEVVVIDSFSTDKTREISREKGARVIEHPFNSHIDQKNFALNSARFDVVLSLDADEYLSEELIESILEVKQDWIADAYQMNRLSNYGGEWIKRGNWYPDRKIRLWDRKKGNWGGNNPHDKVILQTGAKLKTLRGNLLHRAYQNSHDAIQKIQKYSTIFAHEVLGRRSVSTFSIFIKTTFSFFKSYILKRGFMDGYEGLMVAFAVSNHALYKYSKLYELTKLSLLGKRVIISRSDSIGDVVLSLPIAGYLKSAVPDIHVTFIGRNYTRDVVMACQHVDDYIGYEDVMQHPHLLTEAHADSIIFIYPNFDLARMAQQAKIKTRVATAHRWYNWLFCNHLIDFSRLNSNQHESILNFQLLKPFKLFYDIDLSEISSLYGLRATDASIVTVSPDKINIVIQPKTKSGKTWSLGKFKQLMQHLSSEKYQLYITGIPSEYDAIVQEDPDFFNQANVVDLTKKLPLREFINFIGQIDIVVSGNTGIMHVSAAMGVHTIGLFSPRRPIHPGRWKPIGKRADYFVGKKTCTTPCGDKVACTCLESIALQDVLKKIESLEPTLHKHSWAPVP